MISIHEHLMGRHIGAPLTNEQWKNLTKLIIAVNKLRTAYGKPLTVSSGYRPPKQNAAAGGAKNSTHLHCMAIDFSDPKGELDAWCMANLDKLEEWGLWLEHPDATPTWTHLDIRPRSNRVFKP
jgi:hypothetical protein